MTLAADGGQDGMITVAHDHIVIMASIQTPRRLELSVRPLPPAAAVTTTAARGRGSDRQRFRRYEPRKPRRPRRPPHRRAIVAVADLEQAAEVPDGVDQRRGRR